MKVLVIGGAGYIGSHVVKEMMKAGHEVTVFEYNDPQFLEGRQPQSERIETTAELNKYIGVFDELNHPTTLAIRPEAFILDDNGTEAEIQFISEMGKDQIVTMTYLGNSVRAILNLDELEQVVSTGSTTANTV